MRTPQPQGQRGGRTERDGGLRRRATSCSGMKVDKCILLCVEMVLNLQVDDNCPLQGVVEIVYIN